MNKMYIWKKDVRGIPGNDPVAIITMKTAPAVVDFWINCLIDNPDKFDIELINVFTFTKRSADNLPNTIGIMLLNYEQIEGKFDNTHVIMSLWAILQGFSFSEEKIDILKEKHNQDNDFDDQFLMNYEE